MEPTVNKFNPECLRKIANWTSMKAYHKFDKKQFNPDKTASNVAVHSPKYLTLLKNIKEADERDMKEHGKVFKHFIFSDLTQNGAKMVAAVLLANGMNIIYDSNINLISDSKLLESKGNNFALLLGTNVYDKPISVKAKKEILSKYNQRPENVFGDLCRFIILDKSFKEGIDLFDVKYAHILEPQTSKADLRQAIGRATRLCGQKGLEFHPTRGWPLNVMLYDVQLPPTLAKEFGANTLYNLFLRNSNIDLRKLAFTDELEGATIHAAVDYELTKTVHRFEIGSDEGYDLTWLFPNAKVGGAKGMLQAKRLSEDVNCKSGCKSRPTKKVPVGTPLLTAVVFASGRDLPNLRKSKPRDYYCNLLKTDASFCDQVREAWKDPVAYLKKNSDNVAKAIEGKKHYNLGAYNRETFLRLAYEVIPELKKKKLLKTAKLESAKAESAKAESVKVDSAKEGDEAIKSVAIASVADKYKVNSTKTNSNGSKSVSPLVDENDVLIEEAPVKSGPVAGLKENPGFLDIREYVRENLTQFTWPKVKLENLCVPKGGGPSTIVSFTPTQDFVRNYFTPSNPIKGMLAWHSVGTGKTCMAIATATSGFEKEGYTILWVTRSSLKSDIWKNMFEQVCSALLQEKMKAGFNIPYDMASRMRLLSKAWSIRPMSYKQFSNLVAGKNKFYEDLVKKNGKEDPLRKTLLIIDEAHKLYGGADLSSVERPDMAKFHKAVMHSYKYSGKDSVRLLMMTGTPITNDPMEMIKLINLGREEDKQLPDDFNAFAKEYLDEVGKFTKKGKWKYLNDIAGQVSYLNRERDARQFSQPVLTPVNVDLSKPDSSYLDALQEVEQKYKSVIADKTLEKDNIKGDIAAIKNKYKLAAKSLKQKCKGLKKEELDQCKKEVMEEAFKYNDMMTQEIKDKEVLKTELASEIKKMKSEYAKEKKAASSNSSQQGYLLDKCFVKPKKAKKEKVNSALSEYDVPMTPLQSPPKPENVKLSPKPANAPVNAPVPNAPITPKP
jgi:hypothetical protein